MGVIFDQVIGELRDGQSGPGSPAEEALPHQAPAESDETRRARLRAELRRLARREARVEAT